jgi:hypothetical protein
MLVHNLLLADAYQVQIIVQRLRERHHRDLIPYLKKVSPAYSALGLVT